jgi:hypothetical protein
MALALMMTVKIPRNRLRNGPAPFAVVRNARTLEKARR